MGDTLKVVIHPLRLIVTPYTFNWNDIPIPDAHWTFENTTNDVTGNGNHQNVGASIGTPAYSNDVVEGQNSLSLDGLTYVRYSIDGAFMEVALTEWMVAFWMKPTSLSGVQYILDEGGGTNGIAVRLNGNILEFATRDASVQINAGTHTVPNDGNWHHVAAVYANDSVTLYLDGIVGTSSATSYVNSEISSHSGNGGIGQLDGGSAFGSGSGSYYAGLLDDFKYYLNQSLTANQIADLARNDGDRTNLSLGTYHVTIQDSDGGCSTIDTIIIAGNCTEICNNGIDDDADGLIDCDDPDCNPTGTNIINGCITVNSTGDESDTNPGDGKCITVNCECTLRAAIEEANALAGKDTICFNIPTSDANYTGTYWPIQPSSYLPAVTEAVFIRGYSQPGANPNAIITPGTSNAVFKIVLDGSSVSTYVPSNSFGHGLSFTASNCEVEGLVINHFTNGNAYGISTLGGNTIRGNYIGTDVAGTIAQGNNRGIEIGGTNNLIGGTSPADRNIISGNNSIGIRMAGDANTIQGNFIGLDATGTVDLGNGYIGLELGASDNNIIGGNSIGSRNYISGNTNAGIHLEHGCDYNEFKGNYIGTDITGTLSIPNNGGFLIEDGIARGVGNIIGSSAMGEGNIISGNGSHAISIRDCDSTMIQGNYIGVDATGVTSLGNGLVGITLTGCLHTTRQSG